jgi:uncharacterized membrane protein
LESERVERVAPAGRRTRVGPNTLVLGAIVLGGAAVRLWGLGAHRLGYDEAFTAMAGRRSLGSLVSFLRLDDSHPPLDYLLRAPLARAGVDEFLFRLPSALCSIGALALLAWWLRRYGLAGVVATALFAVSAFELRHGRTARMYAELELMGVGAAMLTDAWLRRPRRWHAPVMAVIVALGLLTHVSMFLLAGGLVAVSGLRRDREAWRWRLAILAGVLGWAVVWGPSFLVQARGGHSDWIPRTTLDRAVHTFGSLVTDEPRLHLLAVLAVVAGAIVAWRRDRVLGRVLLCCAFVPAGLAAATGLFAPVLLDRTLTLASWGGAVAIGFLVGAVATRSRTGAIVMCAALALVALPAMLHVLDTPSTPDLALRHIERVEGLGDVVAIRPGGKFAELAWSIGVRSGTPYHEVAISQLGNTRGVALGSAPLTGRIWLLDWTGRPIPTGGRARCAPDWSSGSSRVVCLR